MFRIIGMIGALCLGFSYLPQIFKLLKSKSSRDVSNLFILFILFGSILLTSYSIYIEDIVFIVLNGTASTNAGIVLVLSVFYEKKQQGRD